MSEQRKPIRFRLEVKPNGTFSRLWLNDVEVSATVAKVEVGTGADSPSVLRVEFANVQGTVEGEAYQE